MINKIIIFFMFLVCIGSASAEKVIIFNLNYDYGEITLKAQMIKDGYYPDRNIQPEDGYKCQLKNDNDGTLYSMKFELPTNVFTDYNSNNKVSGGVIILNETDFSFVMPYRTESKNLVCYNKRGYEILRGEVIHPVMSPEKGSKLWAYFLIIALVAALAVYIIKTYRK
jgi:hypothetical protein